MRWNDEGNWNDLMQTSCNVYVKPSIAMKVVWKKINKYAENSMRMLSSHLPLLSESLVFFLVVVERLLVLFSQKTVTTETASNAKNAILPGNLSWSSIFIKSLTSNGAVMLMTDETNLKHCRFIACLIAIYLNRLHNLAFDSIQMKCMQRFLFVASLKLEYVQFRTLNGQMCRW